MDRNLPFHPVPAFALVLAATLGVPAHAQQEVSSSQKATAQQVSQAGVPLTALAPDAPNAYTVKAGDTLWSVATVFLTSPWRWPELWGMNMAEIRNPHRISPGQVLVLDKSRETARLRLQQQETAETAGISSVKVVPQTRYATVTESAVPVVKSGLIEPFLVTPLIVNKEAMDLAPRIVSATEGRVLITKGDRAYAMSVYEDDVRQPQLQTAVGKSRLYRIFRNANPLKDPATGEVLGYEAKHIGTAQLQRSEVVAQVPDGSGSTRRDRQPATVDIVEAKEEILAGDRLLPDPPRNFQSFVPHAPDKPLAAQILSLHGDAVNFAGQNQVVAINKGHKDGVEAGHVLAIQRNVTGITDKTDERMPMVKLPIERNGLLMVFRTFERLSYALVLDITDAVQVGDRLTNP